MEPRHLDKACGSLNCLLHAGFLRFIYFYLESRITEKGREGEIFYPLVYSFPQITAIFQIWISHVGAGAQALGCPPLFSQAQKQEAGSGVEQLGQN